MSAIALAAGIDTGFDPVPGHPDQLRGAARALRAVAGDLSERSHEVDGAVERTTAAWTGRRSLDFRLAATGVAHALEATVSGVADLADALGELSAAAQVARDEVEQQATRSRRVTGEMEDRVRAMAPGDTDIEAEHEHARRVHRRCLALAQDANKSYDRMAQRVAERIEAIADTAGGVVAPVDLSTLATRRVQATATGASSWSLLDDWLHPCGAVPGVVETVLAISTPRAAYAWWRALSPVQQQTVLRDRPELIGNLDGIPAGVRDLANRERLWPLRREVSARLRQRMDELSKERQRRGAYNPYAGPVPLLTSADPRFEHRLEQLRALTALGAVLARPGRHLLSLDISSGHRVHAAVAVGDVDTADNVAVFTPGLDSNVQNGIADYDTEMGDLRAQAEADSADAGTSTATVTWLGYDAPQVEELWNGQRSVASARLAEQGAAGLSGFLGGIQATRPHGVHLVALGHSYGSSTTGYALARADRGVDDAVLFGSPGAGVDTLQELHVPAGHLYVEATPTDLVALVERFGLSPTHTVGFQALEVGESARNGTVLPGVNGHRHYLDAGTTSMWNLAALVADRRDLLVVAPESAQPELLQHLR